MNLERFWKGSEWTAGHKISIKCLLLEYNDPRILYKDYLGTIKDYKHIPNQFAPLKAFFFGNTESLNINKFICQFRSNLNGLTADIADGFLYRYFKCR